MDHQKQIDKYLTLLVYTLIALFVYFVVISILVIFFDSIMLKIFGAIGTIAFAIWVNYIFIKIFK